MKCSLLLQFEMIHVRGNQLLPVFSPVYLLLPNMDDSGWKAAFIFLTKYLCNNLFSLIPHYKKPSLCNVMQYSYILFKDLSL